MGGKTLIGESEKKAYDSKEKLRVEKMAILDEENNSDFGNKASKKNKGGVLIGASPLSNFNLKKNSTDMSFLNSDFDSFQLKRTSEFEPVAQASKAKNGKFTPVEAELKKNPYKGLDIKPLGELSQKRREGLNLAEVENESKRKTFEEVEQEINRKRASFKENEKELNRKKTQFDEVQRQFEKKSLPKVGETEEERNKRKKFEAAQQDLNRKRAELEKNQQKMELKKKNFTEIENDYKKKRVQFDQEYEEKKKKGLEIQVLELAKKKKKLLDELDELEKKNRGIIEEVLEDKELKKLQLDDYELNKKRSNAVIGEEDLAKKSNDFEEVDISKNKKKSNFEEDNTTTKKNHTEFLTQEENNKKKQFNEIDLDKEKVTGSQSLDDENQNKKKKPFNEILIGGAKNKNQEIDLEAKKKKDEQLALGQENKKKLEQTLDYSEFKKLKKSGELYLSTEDESAVNKKIADKLLEQPEYTFYENLSYGLEYLVIHNDFLFKDNMTKEQLYKFIHFALIKEYDGDMSLYLSRDSAAESNNKNCKACLYSGHIARKNEVVQNDFENFERENLESWYQQKLPFWNDETYQTELNEFIYPYFEEGEYLGFALCHFRGTIKTHADATKVELLALILKGAILEEFEKAKGS